MLKMKTATALLMLLTSLMLCAAIATTIVKAEGTTRIWTDKMDYAPEETVTIYGEGFQGKVALTVVRPDGSINDPEHGIIGEWTVEADENGKFQTTYQLDGILGTYTVTATDNYGNTATTTFTDADIGTISVLPETRTITAGGTATYTVTVQKKGGSTLSVDLSIVGSLPSGCVVTFNPNPVTFSSSDFGTKTSTLTIQTSASGSTGTFNFIVRGTKSGTGDKADSSQVSLVVEQPTFAVTFDATTSPGLPADIAGETQVDSHDWQWIPCFSH